MIMRTKLFIIITQRRGKVKAFLIRNFIPLNIRLVYLQYYKCWTRKRLFEFQNVNFKGFSSQLLSGSCFYSLLRAVRTAEPSPRGRL